MATRILEISHERTRKALVWMGVSHEPFLVFYALLPFILRKDLGASLLQISILSSLRPIIPIFAFYWSANLTNQKKGLRSNLMGAWFLARVPFVFVFWIQNVWYLIFCCVMYELFNKSGIPALIEILKINMPKESREKTYTFLYMLTFIESILLGLLMAGVLDRFSSSWQVVCSVTVLLSMTSIFLQRKVPIAQEKDLKPSVRLPFFSQLTGPWKDAFKLLKSRPDFARFQYGFMMGGFGLMLIAPSLSLFYVDYLQLSHSELIWGRSILMGIGVVISSSLWRQYLAVEYVPQMTRWILFGFALFPFVLVLSQISILFFYISFIFYGVAQSGSHLLWNLSGTLFAVEEDSSPFSRVNILMLGLRGIIAPGLGGLLCNWAGPLPVLILGGSICIAGSIYMMRIRLAVA
ncbi:MAG: MFS transporter [Chlamydiota bacterium]